MFLVIYHQEKLMIQENTPGLSVVSVCPHKISRTRAYRSSKDVTAGPYQSPTDFQIFYYCASPEKKT